MSAGVSRFRRVAGGAALAVLLGTLSWLAFHWATLPDVLPLRMNLNSAPTLGSKARLLFLPPLMGLVFLTFSWSERTGVLNMPDLGSPGRNRAAAREASAGLRFFCTALLALLLLSMVAMSDAAPPGVVRSFFAWVGGAGLAVWLVTALRRR
ncbi:hypothetical protein F8S09_16265 [Deinococcus sp. SDU3-2]|uniref:DUF1648 domain-containing protein n=1 Tax=Deinococcus terrestris TaxID=2651870 RepID=A0A7X1NZI5_9DEIO|nr:hypothetical protein [Deinococcus terrestris]MPY68211.1 hypothetical protein [Deinococcus terrestris]